MTNSPPTTIALNDTQSITASCPSGFTFSACSKYSKVPFFGCFSSKVDPCKQGCVGNDLQSASYDPQLSHFSDQACNGTGSFYTCADTAKQFAGCCTIDPCQGQQICPSSNLRAAVRLTFNASSATTGLSIAGSATSSKPTSSASSVYTASTPTQSAGQQDLAPGAIAGIAGGGCGLLLALGIGVFFFLRRRKRAKTASGMKKAFLPESPNSAAVRVEPLYSPVGSESEQPSPLNSPVGTVSTSRMGWSHSQPSVIPKISPKALMPHSSSEYEFQSTPPPPSYHSPQAMMFPELDSKQVPAVLPELDPAPTANAPRDQAPVPPLDPPAAVAIPTKEVQEARAEQGGELPVMKGNAGGPGWDNWNEQARPRVISKQPSTAYNSLGGPSLSGSSAGSRFDTTTP